MKHFIIALLVAFSQLAEAQILDLSKLATKDDVAKVNARIDSLNKVGGQPSGPAVPELDPCKAGPRIEEIYNITTTGAKVRFHGVGVYGMDFGVYNSSGTRVSFGIITPTSSVVTIVYAGLPSGTYTLKLTGNTCKGEDSKTFSIAPTGSVVIPEPDPDPTGNIATSLIAQGMSEHMDIRYTCDVEKCVYNDVSPVLPPPGFSFRYFINSDIVTTDKPLKDYVYESRWPAGIRKMKCNNSAEHMWIEASSGADLWKIDPFSGNSSVAFTYLYLK